MNRNRWILVGLAVITLLAAAGGGAYWAASQVPEFYVEAMAELADPVQRREAAKELVQKTTELVEEIERSPRWSQTFTQTHINAWLAEELPRHFAERLPKGVSEPRIDLEQDAIRIGARVEHGAYNGVVSLKLRAWVPEDNQLAVEIETVRAGLLPVPLDEVFDELTRRIQRAGHEVAWHQADGHDVAVIHLNPRELKSSVLEAVEFVEGAVKMTGRRDSDETGTRQAKLAAQSAAG
ncbi:MAG: hypothetical protein KY476_11090 [Planctomycetes bacterium]|nr:hypothetical protein [Planctomycetota bacterium]